MRTSCGAESGGNYYYVHQSTQSIRHTPVFPGTKSRSWQSELLARNTTFMAVSILMPIPRLFRPSAIKPC